MRVTASSGSAAGSARAGAPSGPASGPVATSSSKSRYPASKPRWFASTAIPALSMAPRSRSREMGSASLPAIAPSSTELSTVPARSATLPRSVSTCRRESSRTARRTRSSLKRPSPIALFSAMANIRWVEAMTVVRSGRDHPVLGGPPRFEKLRRDEEVHVARSGKESHDPAPGVRSGHRVRALNGTRIGALVGTRTRAVRAGSIGGRTGGAGAGVASSIAVGSPPIAPAPRTDLEVVGGGAGPLRDPGHGGRLHDPAIRRGRVHEPVREHSAALAAEGRDEDRPRPFGSLRPRTTFPGFLRTRGETGSRTGGRRRAHRARPDCRVRRDRVGRSEGRPGGCIRSRTRRGRAQARVRLRSGIRVRVSHGGYGSGSGVRRGRARRSPWSERRGGAGPRPRGCSRPRPGRTTGRAPRRARPLRRGRIPRSRC